MTWFTRCRSWLRRQRKVDKVVDLAAWRLAQQRQDDWKNEGWGGFRW